MLLEWRGKQAGSRKCTRPRNNRKFTGFTLSRAQRKVKCRNSCRKRHPPLQHPPTSGFARQAGEKFIKPPSYSPRLFSFRSRRLLVSPLPRFPSGGRSSKKIPSSSQSSSSPSLFSPSQSVSTAEKEKRRGGRTAYLQKNPEGKEGRGTKKKVRRGKRRDFSADGQSRRGAGWQMETKSLRLEIRGPNFLTQGKERDVKKPWCTFVSAEKKARRIRSQKVRISQSNFLGPTLLRKRPTSICTVRS